MAEVNLRGVNGVQHDRKAIMIVRSVSEELLQSCCDTRVIIGIFTFVI